MLFVLLASFSKGPEPQNCMLKLLDVIAGSTAPAASDCLLSLTCLMNHLLSGKLLLSCIAPWLCGVSLTALLKKVEGSVQLLWVE